MITANGYSKDPSIMPEGIAVTLPVQFFEDRKMTPADFEKYFVRLMANEDMLWNYRLTNLPKLDVIYVYFIFDGFLQYRLNLVMYERNKTKSFSDTPRRLQRTFEKCNWVVCSGPAVKCPYDRTLKGFQGFRYTTKLF